MRALFQNLEKNMTRNGRANIKRKEICWKAADRNIIKTMNSKEHDKAAFNDKGLPKVEEHETSFEIADVLDDSKISTIWITRPDNDHGKIFLLLFKDQTQDKILQKEEQKDLKPKNGTQRDC